MAATQSAQSGKDKAARIATKERRLERQAKVQAKRDAAQKEKAESGRPTRLCALATVEVKRSKDGFQLSVNGTQGTRTITMSPEHINQILRDLETAILVIRGQM